MIPLTSIPVPVKDAVRMHCQTRIETMRSYRLSWWSHWAALAEMFLPRRYRYFVTPNQWSRGTQLNQAIVDETGVVAARTLATGLLANLTSPTKPWFRLGLHGVDNLPEGPVKAYLAECTKRMLAVYAQSNLYSILGTAYHDNCVFGSAAIIQYEDPEDIVRFYSRELGSFFFGLDNRLVVDTLYDEYTYTVAETVKEFGMENLPESLQTLARSSGNLDTEIVIGRAIEPNGPVYVGGVEAGYAVPKRFPYREVIWMQATAQGGRGGDLLRVGGFLERPFVGLRWDVTSNDAYGRSPGMDALPAVRQLQIEQRRKAEAIDKMVRPPMVASVSMKNEPMDILPGGVTFCADIGPQTGFRPAFTVEPRISEMMEDLKEVQDRVREIMFNPLFTGITDLQTVRTATEIDARMQEKLLMLGPVVERTENEGLDETIERTFAIMSRRGMLPPAPAEIQGRALKIEYISILAEAQRASAIASVERVYGFAGNLFAAIPAVLDNLNSDKSIDYYADLVNLPPDQVNDAKTVAAIRAARGQQQQAAAALQVGQAAAQGAQTLSQTDLGNGKSALQALAA